MYLYIFSNCHRNCQVSDKKSKVTGGRRLFSCFFSGCCAQSLHGMFVPEKPRLPKFYTPIDEVDLSIKICGIK